jgi:hypothetical protein
VFIDTAGGNSNNVTVSSGERPIQGTSNAYALRKLRGDRPLDRADVGERGNPTGANQYTVGGNDNNVNNSSGGQPIQGNG